VANLTAGPATLPPREPNCTPADKHTVDRAGLVHEWKLVDDTKGDTYLCARCGAVDYD
jgi:hypothetical protein